MGCGTTPHPDCFVYSVTVSFVLGEASMSQHCWCIVGWCMLGVRQSLVPVIFRLSPAFRSWRSGGDQELPTRRCLGHVVWVPFCKAARNSRKSSFYQLFLFSFLSILQQEWARRPSLEGTSDLSRAQVIYLFLSGSLQLKTRQNLQHRASSIRDRSIATAKQERRRSETTFTIDVLSWSGTRAHLRVCTRNPCPPNCKNNAARTIPV